MPSPLHTPAVPEAGPVTFALDGDEYTLPVLDTATWLGALSMQQPGCWWLIVPDALPSHQAERLYARLTDPEDGLDLDELETAATAVVSAVCGVEWYAANVLAATVCSNWLVFSGWCAERGLDPLTARIDRVLAACYQWQRSQCEKKSQVARLDARTWTPPVTTASGRPRDPAPQGWDEDVEAAWFDAALAQAGGARGR